MEGSDKKASPAVNADVALPPSLEGYTVVEVLANLKVVVVATDVRAPAADSRPAQDAKTVAVHCRFREQDALVILSKKDWSEDKLRALFAASAAAAVALRLDEHNAEYYQFTGALLDDTKVAITWPCSRQTLDKWRPAEFRLVRETPAMYAAATLPFVEAIPAKANAWVANVFNGTAEAERVLFLDNDAESGFVIAPDFKMDTTGNDPTSIYLQCILRDSRLRSLRDLTSLHLPLLRRVRSTALTLARTRYNCAESQLRFYFHYFPVRIFVKLFVPCTN